MKPLALPIVLALWLSSNVLSADVTWISGLDEAIAHAHAAKKPLLVHLRGDCGRCNRKLDELLANAEKHEAILHAYGSFTLCRLEPGPDFSRLETAGNEKLPRPSVALLSPSGLYVMATDARDLNEYAAFLNRSRGQSERIALIDVLRAEGRWLDAELMAGRVALTNGDFERGKEVFDRVLAACIETDDEQKGELAAIEGDTAAFLANTSWDARRPLLRHLESLARESRFPENAAIAHLRMGLLQVSNPSIATEQFRLALAKAPPESETAKYAAEWLRSQGVIVLPTAPSNRQTVRIIKPERATLTGKVHFLAECAPKVARVNWLQDGTPVGSGVLPDFAVTLDLGAVPRLHTIRAVAYDVTGNAVGETEVAINDRVDAFRVAIVSPVTAVISGPVTIEAEAQAPVGSRIQSVTLLWNEQTITVASAPPYRATFDIPKEFGFIRAVATLDDGRTAEETRPVNERVLSMPVSVHEIVFPVTVTNRRGPVHGLAPADFVVKDEGSRVPVTFQDDEGSTIGLALDSSSSMSKSLLDVIEMSSEIIAEAVTPKDRAFVMAFDDQPYILEKVSSDVERLRTAAFDMRPVGTTSLYDAIAFGLQQFTGLPGRRALVVITDGIDIRSDQNGENCARMAREIGVPVYVIVTTGWWPSANQQRLETIARETAGGIFFAPTREQQLKIFQRIRDEVRSQYLLTFAAPPSRAGAWRKIRVELPKVRGTVRSIAGYYAR